MNEKYRQRLPEELNQQVFKLFKEGDRFQMGHKNLKAVQSFQTAYELLPEPKDQWNYTSSLLGSIAENYFLKAFFDSKSKEESEKYYFLSLEYLESYIQTPGNIGRADNHGRIGQIWYEIGNLENAKEEFLRAYADTGKEWFNDVKPEYYELIKPIVEK